MRFGDGVELSINTSGNLKQPFYLSVGGTWRQLTYTNVNACSRAVPYALDSKFGVGGDGTNYIGMRHGDLVQSNPSYGWSGF